MVNPKIFCHSPWYEFHVYWDGTLGFCCQAEHKSYSKAEESIYNVRNMSIREWYNSLPMRDARMRMFGNVHNTTCTGCYHAEEHSGTSRRVRCNQKSAIFTKTNFFESYEQSPGYSKFTRSHTHNGEYDGMPIDIHLDFGNHCNLTCKMCSPSASSSIASQYVKWGIKDAAQYVGTDWTRDDAVWNKVLNELVEIPNLYNIHLMGGETLISPRFEQFVDFLIEKKKFDLMISFVTNGTLFNQELLTKLKKFKRVGIELSIECITEHNQYQRQGTDTALVLKNINRYLENCDGEKITLTLRPAIGLLTVGYYHTLLRYCLENNIIAKSQMVFDPAYFDPRILPEDIKSVYKKSYQQLIEDFGLESIDSSGDFNESDPNQTLVIIKNQILQCINLLEAPRLPNSNKLLTEMVEWCRKWDNVHGYNALDLYPEMREIFVNNGY